MNILVGRARLGQKKTRAVLDFQAARRDCVWPVRVCVSLSGGLSTFTHSRSGPAEKCLVCPITNPALIVGHMLPSHSRKFDKSHHRRHDYELVVFRRSAVGKIGSSFLHMPWEKTPRPQQFPFLPLGKRVNISACSPKVTAHVERDVRCQTVTLLRNSHSTNTR